MITPRQIRAARALLGWKITDLAKATSLATRTLNNLENENAQTREGTIDAIVRAFDSAGIEFIENEGIRVKSNEVETFIGIDRFQDFMEFMYKYLDLHGGEICISVTDERILQSAYRNIEYHRSRMYQLVKSGKVSGRILAAESNFKQTWATLRRRPKAKNMPQASFYVFGDCFALIALEHKPGPYIVLHKSSPFASQYMQDFNTAWENAEKV